MNGQSSAPQVKSLFGLDRLGGDTRHVGCVFNNRGWTLIALLPNSRKERKHARTKQKTSQRWQLRKEQQAHLPASAPAVSGECVDTVGEGQQRLVDVRRLPQLLPAIIRRRRAFRPEPKTRMHTHTRTYTPKRENYSTLQLAWGG